jgi:hypothetical protein
MGRASQIPRVRAGQSGPQSRVQANPKVGWPQDLGVRNAATAEPFVLEARLIHHGEQDGLPPIP